MSEENQEFLKKTGVPEERLECLKKARSLWRNMDIRTKPRCPVYTTDYLLSNFLHIWCRSNGWTARVSPRGYGWATGPTSVIEPFSIPMARRKPYKSTSSNSENTGGIDPVHSVPLSWDWRALFSQPSLVPLKHHGRLIYFTGVLYILKNIWLLGWAPTREHQEVPTMGVLKRQLTSQPDGFPYINGEKIKRQEFKRKTI